MDPRDFLDVAFDLAGEFREADWRTAIDRAYFAAFHVACEFMKTCGFSVPQNDQAHGHAWIRLANCAEPQLIQAGRDLHRLRLERNEADYRLGTSVLQRTATTNVRRAEAVVGVLDRAAASASTLVQIVPVMRDFERDVLGDVTWQGPTP